MDVAVAPQTTIIRYELLNDRMISHGRFKPERTRLWILVSPHYLLSELASPLLQHLQEIFIHSPYGLKERIERR